MSQHTPGPWSFGPADTDDPRFMIGPDIDTMNIVAMTAMGNDEANAHLIAAAPDLLAVARRFLDFARPGNGFSYPPGSMQGLVNAARKAEGKPPL